MFVNNFYFKENPEFVELNDKADGLIAKAINELQSDAWVDLIQLQETVADANLTQIEDIVKQLKTNFKNIIILGTGGSSLTGQVYSFFKPDHNIKLLFADNIDPYNFSMILNDYVNKDSCFICISKSGKTVETLAQFMLVRQELLELGLPLSKHIIAITDPASNPLRTIALDDKIQIIDHPPIGGRFSIFDEIGLIPAKLIGADIAKVKLGASEVFKTMYDLKSGPVQAAKHAYIYMQMGFPIFVFMPYIDRLSGLANWLRQIQAESLGKNGLGPTPVKAAGTVDQHSQLQLFLDGPRDKYFTFINLNQQGKGKKILGDLTGEMSFLNNKYLGDVISVEQQVTMKTLQNRNIPVREIVVPEFNEIILGGLIAHFIAEVVILAQMLGVNPFDQPAVEEGKRLAKEMLGKAPNL